MYLFSLALAAKNKIVSDVHSNRFTGGQMFAFYLKQLSITTSATHHLYWPCMMARQYRKIGLWEEFLKFHFLFEVKSQPPL